MRSENAPYIVVVGPHHPSSSRIVVVYCLCAIYVDVALRRALLHIVVVVLYLAIVRCRHQVTKQTIFF